MTMRRFTVCAYALLAESRDEEGIEKLDAALEPPSRDEQRAERREQLAALGIGV